MVIFDKTGTLTRGSPAVSGLAPAPGTSENDLLVRAAAVEGNSEHPLAKAIVAEAQRRHLSNSNATDFEALPGRGAQAKVNGKTIVVGGPRLLIQTRAIVPPEIEKVTTTWSDKGKTVTCVVEDGRLLGAFALEDEIRPESREAVQELHQLGLQVAMITGDSKRVADSVAHDIGIDRVASRSPTC